MINKSNRILSPGLRASSPRCSCLSCVVLPQLAGVFVPRLPVASVSMQESPWPSCTRRITIERIAKTPVGKACSCKISTVCESHCLEDTLQPDRISHACIISMASNLFSDTEDIREPEEYSMDEV